MSWNAGEEQLVRWLTWIALAATIAAGAECARAEEASWYSTEACRYNPAPSCPTASGQSLYELEQQGVLFAAAWGAPFGTKLRVCRKDELDRCVTVIVLDRGPAKRLGRAVDLSRAAFQRLASLKAGVVQVSITREEGK